jgi:serine/threonine protein kinase
MGEESSLESGTEIAGRYRIEEMIGQGGFATVYRAVQQPIGRPVAVKLLETDLEEVGRQADRALDRLVARFHREARIIGQLQSPATVTLHDFGRTPADDIYMVLEYIDGVALTELRGQRLAPDRVVAILRQALESLGEAHEHGVLHRDIKPGNLMLYEHRGEADRVKILDFGIAKVLRTTDREMMRQLTGESRLVGTPRYLAPELATNRNPGPPADIYSLGLVAYELLVGVQAVPGEAPHEILEVHLADDFRVRLSDRPSLPDGLRRIVNRMLARDPEERYATTEAVLAELAELPNFGDDYAETSSRPGPTGEDVAAETQPPEAFDPTAEVGPSTGDGSTETAEQPGTTEQLGPPSDVDDIDLTDVEPSTEQAPIVGTSRTETEDATAPTLQVDDADSTRTDAPGRDPTRRSDERRNQTPSPWPPLAIGAILLLVGATVAILWLFVF